MVLVIGTVQVEINFIEPNVALDNTQKLVKYQKLLNQFIYLYISRTVYFLVFCSERNFFPYVKTVITDLKMIAFIVFVVHN